MSDNVQTDLTKPNSFSYRATYTVLGDIYYYNQAEEITAVDIELLRNKEHTLFAGLIQRDKHFLIGRLTLEVIKKDILNNSEINTQEISDLEASPQMRRQLMRLRNSLEFS